MDMSKDGHKYHQAKCPACGKFFNQRNDGRPKSCSRTCARRIDAKVHGPSNWKGGRWKINTGYVKVIAKDHPRADANGYVLEHVIVMESTIGRHLHEFERVHHKNGKRDDNRPENLELWCGNNGRSKKDPSGQRMVDLMDEFFSLFDGETRDDVEHKFRRVFRI